MTHFEATVVVRIPFLAKMTSRLRGPSTMKDAPRAAVPFAKDHFHRNEPEVHSDRSCKNDGRGSRYHFGMSRQHENKPERNGRECTHRDEATVDGSADLLYRKSREHFGSWGIKDIVQDDAKRTTRRQENEDARLTNGKLRSEPVVGAKLDKPQDRPEYRDEGYVGSLPREDHDPRSESVERELPNGSHKSRKRESLEEDAEARNRSRTFKASKSKDDDKDTAQPVDERDILLKEIENLAIDRSQSPDRRIQAMIERLKSREESKLRSRREHRSMSPEKEAHGRTRSSGRSEPRSPIGDQSLDNWSNDRGGRRLRDDREKDTTRCDRSVDRRSRSTDRSNENRNDPRRDDSFPKRSDTHNTDIKSHRRRTREDEEYHPRARADSSKRRSYAYDGSPEDFDVRIQKYDRALLEPRRDLDRTSPRRASPKDSGLSRRESLKEHDREPVTRKSSFKMESKRATSKDRGESSLTRKSSLKDQDGDAYKSIHSSKNQHETPGNVRYFGKDQGDLTRKDSMKDASAETSRKNYFKIPDDEFGRILLPKSQRDDTDCRKVPSKEHAGVSRIVLRNFDDESGGNNSFKNMNEDSSGKNSTFNEKNSEFGGASHKNRESDPDRKKNSLKENDGDFGYQDYENNMDRKTANDRYIEFGKISFKTQDDELRTVSPFKVEDHEAVARASSFKERDVPSRRRVSLRNKGREALDRKPDSHHVRALSPLNKNESELSSREDNSKDAKDFCSKAWHESNRTFSAKYLREHSKLRNAQEGRLEASPEQGFSILLQDSRSGAIEASTSDLGDDRFGTRSRIDSGDGGSPRFSSTRDRNGATIIRIRSSEDPSNAERRRRRRPAQEISAAVRRRRYEDENDDEDSEDEAEDRWRRTRRDGGGVLPGRGSGGDAGSGGATPSRTMWNYREGVWHFHESIAFDRSFMVQRREAIFINRWRR